MNWQTGKSCCLRSRLLHRFRDAPLGAFERLELPLKYLSVVNRDGEDREKDVFDSNMVRFQPCNDLLEEAVAQGNPNPVTAGLGGCNDLTPLQVAKIIFEALRLLDAGEDPNV